MRIAEDFHDIAARLRALAPAAMVFGEPEVQILPARMPALRRCDLGGSQGPAHRHGAGAALPTAEIRMTHIVPGHTP